MDILRKADKQQEKAVNTRSKALNTFSNAVDEIERANNLLREANVLELQELGKKRDLIKVLESEIEQLQGRSEDKVSQIKDNEELINRLSQFTVNN